MIKASALYIVIIIALVIAIICSALIVSAYFYRLQYQKKMRYDLLCNNLGSARNILIAGSDTAYTDTRSFSLFNMDNDSVSTQRLFWGIYDVGVARAFIQSDTLYQVFSMANTIDSAKWGCLYLTDNDRPLGLSGNTAVTGDVFIPPSGVNQAYIDNKPYTGDSRLIIGVKHNSQKQLSALDSSRLLQFKRLLNQDHGLPLALPKRDTLSRSFLQQTQVINLGKEVTTIKNMHITGNVIIFSDTLLTIDSTAVLTNLLVFAQSISVKGGFTGICQLYARDTIGIASNARFGYPSCLGILRFDHKTVVSSQAKISLYGHSTFSGLIFTYEKNPTKIPALVHIGSKTIIKGQVYSQGFTELQSNAEIDGAVFTNGFLFQTSYTRYENYINNASLDEKRLSPYYLTSSLFPAATKKKKVLQWLEAN
jgi:hypothetical protein